MTPPPGAMISWIIDAIVAVVSIMDSFGLFCGDYQSAQRSRGRTGLVDYDFLCLFSFLIPSPVKFKLSVRSRPCPRGAKRDVILTMNLN